LAWNAERLRAKKASVLLANLIVRIWTALPALFFHFAIP
jgi:hypothetical protein